MEQIILRYFENQWYDGFEIINYDEVNHWMRLPEPPNE